MRLNIKTMKITDGMNYSEFWMHWRYKGSTVLLLLVGNFVICKYLLDHSLFLFGRRRFIIETSNNSFHSIFPAGGWHGIFSYQFFFLFNPLPFLFHAHNLSLNIIFEWCLQQYRWYWNVYLLTSYIFSQGINCLLLRLNSSNILPNPHPAILREHW